MASRLTTTDNPFNPFTEWNQWFQWDEAAGYHTTSYLARIVVMSDEQFEADQDAAIEEAIDEILEMNLLGIYKRASPPQTEETATKV